MNLDRDNHGGLFFVIKYGDRTQRVICPSNRVKNRKFGRGGDNCGGGVDVGCQVEQNREDLKGEKEAGSGQEGKHLPGMIPVCSGPGSGWARA